MFPTHVGMNRGLRRSGIHTDDVPHTRGDEPDADLDVVIQTVCSPHTWG